MYKEKGSITIISWRLQGRKIKGKRNCLGHCVASVLLRPFEGLILEKSLGKVMHPGNSVGEVGIWCSYNMDRCLVKVWSGKMGWAALFVACNFTVACQPRGQFKTIFGDGGGAIWLSTAFIGSRAWRWKGREL